MSSIYVVAKGKSASIESICLWKVWAAFLRPKGMNMYSKRPKGVIIAVFGTSVAETGIWWYALCKSTVEKMVAPSNQCRSSVMSGRG